MPCAKGRSSFAEIAQQHATAPLHIEPTSNLSIDAVRTRARRMKRQYGIGLLIIDYLHLLRATDSSLQARQNRTIEVSEITRGLKSIAKDLNIMVLALSRSPVTWKSARINGQCLRTCVI
jgi:replicative DNA helicase